MGFLIFGHVYGDEVVFPAIEQFGKGEGRFCLADAARSYEHEDPCRFRRIFDACMSRLNGLGNSVQGVVLADDALAQQPAHVENGLDLIDEHSSRRNACPGGNDLRDGLGLHCDLHEGVAFLDRREIALKVLEGDLFFPRDSRCRSPCRRVP